MSNTQMQHCLDRQDAGAVGVVTNLTPMRKGKTKVLVLVRYYRPGDKSGGPVRTISNMVDQLSDEFDFCIVTSDRDVLDQAPYGGVIVDAWNQIGNAQVYYLSPGNRSLRSLARLCSATPHDVMYLNSFFDPVFTQWPLLARRLGLLPDRPVIVAPRGEFSPGALRLKRWKKAPYKRLALAIGLYRDLTWQASSNREAEDIQRALGSMARKISVAHVLSPVFPWRDLQENGSTKNGVPLRIVFLARITPMKNLDFALRVLARVNIPVCFNIFGPIEDEHYWRQCERLMAELPPGISVRYEGAVEHSQAGTVLETHDLFFLPTRGENYGHVIMESLAAGTPVLIADTTPWRDLEEAGVGWALPLDDAQQFADKIHETAQLSNEAYRRWRRKVHSYARERAIDPEIVASNRRLFIEAAGAAASVTN